jgi:hypothetical protein
MKKLKFENKLSLKKEAISTLNNGQLIQIQGGGPKATAIGVTCVSAGVTCGCPAQSLHSGCSC